MEWILWADQGILQGISQLRTPLGDWLMPLVTSLGNGGLVWILLGAVLLFLPKYRKAGVAMLTAMLLAVAVGSLFFKPLLARARPFAQGEVALLIPPPQDFSFPSGHTSSSVAAALALFRRDRRWGGAALALAATIAFSRMYLYVHYPSDVLAGALLGAVAVFPAEKLAGWAEGKFPKKAA